MKFITTQLSLMALLPQIVKRVNLPVIAAGGIADRNGALLPSEGELIEVKKSNLSPRFREPCSHYKLWLYC